MKHLIKEIARGAKGARDLSESDAKLLMTSILEGQVSDLELGAIAIAIRIKGEGLDELLGFEAALRDVLPRIKTTTPAIVLPSYNGARKSALLTPLIAALLARSGVPTLIHGHHEEDARVSSESVFQALGWPIATTPQDIDRALENEGFVYVPLSTLSPPLTVLLDLRKTLGLRNFGHVLTKLMNVIEGESLRLVNYTHPEYPEKLGQFFKVRGESALLMRGHEGEPTCSFNRIPELVFFRRGEEIQRCPEKRFDPAEATRLAQDSVAFTRAVIMSDLPTPAVVSDFCATLKQSLTPLPPSSTRC